MDSNSSLQREVLRLRNQLLITQLAGAAAILAGASLIAIVSQPKAAPERSVLPADTSTINVRSLVLVDDRGNERASLRCSRTGQPMLTLIGADGAKIDLGFSGEKSFDLPGLTIRDARDRDRLSLYSQISAGQGGSGLVVQDDRGDVAISLGYGSAVGSGLSLKSTASKDAHASVSMFDGFPHIQLIDANGKHLLDVPPLP